MKPGEHEIKITNYGLIANKDGVVSVAVTIMNRENEELTSVLSFKGGALAITLENLEYLGLKDSVKDLPRLAQGPMGGALDCSKVYKVTVVNEEYEGKTRAKVKYWGEGGLKILDAGEALQKFNASDIMGRVIALKQQANGVAISTNEIPTSKHLDDIPF